MGQHVHKLTNVDPNARTAVCANCGPVAVTPNKNKRNKWWRCATATVENNHRNRFRKYGLSAEQFQEMVARQKGRCATGCGRPGQFIDHDHETGKVRELICHHCNIVLGHAFDSPEQLENLASYLRRHQ